MEENRQAILDALVAVLRLTRAGQFVISLKIVDDNQVEITEHDDVRYGRLINIGADSGTAMIIDIIEDLMW